MQYEEFLSWLLYYVALFDVDKTPQIEIAEPLGLVQSQAVESPDGGLRITLNGSMARRRFRAVPAAYMGAGVQHLAFATADVFARPPRLRAARAGDPVESRTTTTTTSKPSSASSRKLVERMAALSILYDRDAGGSISSSTAAPSLSGCSSRSSSGAATKRTVPRNASIRLAAQARFKNLPPAVPLTPRFSHCPIFGVLSRLEYRSICCAVRGFVDG